jgi:hypothetical protein
MVNEGAEQISVVSAPSTDHGWWYVMCYLFFAIDNEKSRLN